jgi:hypothetical protein
VKKIVFLILLMVESVLCQIEVFQNFSIKSTVEGVYSRTSYFRTHYMFVSNDLQLDILKLKDYRVSTEFNFITGLGQNRDGVIFDPVTQDFWVIYSLVLPVKKNLLILGLDHQCYHEVNVVNEVPITTWNALFVKFERDFWEVAIYLYLRKFSEFVPDKAVGHYCPFVWEITGNLEHNLFSSFYIFSKTRVGQASNDRAFVQQQVRCKYLFYRKNFDFGLFLCYSLDNIPKVHEQPRFSRNNVFEAGIEFLK